MQQSQQVSEAARTGNVDTLQGAQAAQATQAVQGVGFGDVLNQFVSEVNDKQIASGQAVNDLLSGKDIPLHQAMIAMQEAGVAFQLMVEVRNKLLEGYQELMRMQV
jgi:flagellar hook-basal body complex protein FliE